MYNKLTLHYASMIPSKLKSILSLNSLSLILGILGFGFGIVAMFVSDYNVEVSLKWFFLITLLFLFLLFVSFKLSYELYCELKVCNAFNHSKAIQFLQPSYILIVEKNNSLEHSAKTTIYYINDRGVEIEMGEGYVYNIQNKFVQIKLTNFNTDFETNNPSEFNDFINNNANILNNVIVKNYTKYNQYD